MNATEVIENLDSASVIIWQHWQTLQSNLPRLRHNHRREWLQRRILVLLYKPVFLAIPLKINSFN